MTLRKHKPTPLTDDEIRQVVLRYLYDRNKSATSRRGKASGAAVTVSVMRADLKASHGLTAQQVHSNLTYLLSQGWVEDHPVAKSFTTSRGGVVPSATSYFIITAAGIDKIGGPSEFTRDRFQGIRIEATGQNVITLGDGNQVNSSFRELGEALAGLRERIKRSDAIDESEKMGLVVDVDTLRLSLRGLLRTKLLSSLFGKTFTGLRPLPGLAARSRRSQGLSRIFFHDLPFGSRSHGGLLAW